MRVSHNKRYHFGGSYNKDYNVLGSIFGFPNFGNLPYRGLCRGDL